AVQLQRVLAYVEVDLDRGLLPHAGLDARSRGDEVADAADVENEARRRARRDRPTEARDHSPAASSRRAGASAWQIATASASAAWCGLGGSGRPRIAFTI